MEKPLVTFAVQASVMGAPLPTPILMLLLGTHEDRDALYVLRGLGNRMNTVAIVTADRGPMSAFTADHWTNTVVREFMTIVAAIKGIQAEIEFCAET